MDGLLHRKQCKGLTDVPAAVDRFARDIDDYETRSQPKLPADWEPLSPSSPCPRSARRTWRCAFRWMKRTSKIAANIVGYSNDERVRAQRAKHSNAMGVGSLEAAKHQTEQEEYGAYVADLEAYYYSEDPDLS